MKIKTNTKAGRARENHNETLARSTKGLRLKTRVKAGRMGMPNHNETLVRGKKGLPLKTNLKAGKLR